MTDRIGSGLAIFSGFIIAATFTLILYGVAYERAYRDVGRVLVHDGTKWVFLEDIK